MSIAEEPLGAGATGRTLPTWALTMRRSLRYGRTRLGLALLGFVAAVALIGPLLAPHSPSEFVGSPFAPPSRGALLGTDYLGQDVLSRVLWGGWSVLWLAVLATFVGLVIGLVVGLIAGYSRSWLDDVLMGATDIVLAFPQIVLALLALSMVGPNLWLIMLIVAVSHAPRIARLTRGVTLEVVHREFVQAAEVLGVPRRRILTREVMPNLTTPLMVEVSLRLVWSIAIIAGLSFLGFGIQPPNADWGLMINENRNGLVISAWGVVAPVVCIGLFAIGSSLVAEGLSRAVAGIDREGGRE